MASGFNKHLLFINRLSSVLTLDQFINSKSIFTMLLLFFLSCKAFAEVRLYVVKPSADHLGYIIPVRDGNKPSDELFQYKKSIQSDPQLKSVFTDSQIKALSAGQIYPLPNDEKIKVLSLANRGYDYEKSPREDGRNRIEKFRNKLNNQIELYVLPIAVAAFLNPVETAVFFNKLSATFAGVIALGGADLDPIIYQESLTESRDINLARDRYEIQFLKHWIQNKKGFLYGVCRGHQLISVALGYKLIQHIDGHGDGKWEQHKIQFKNTTAFVFERIFGAEKKNILVNSFHHQAVIYQPGLNPEIELAATDSKGTVESLSSRDGRIFTTQFHPEFMDGYVSKRLFSYLDQQFKRSAPLSCQKLF